MGPLFLGAALLVAVPAPAQDTPRDLRDMVGARAGQAEGELARRGYRNVGGEKGDDRSYTYWWNAERRRCVAIATMDGRYDSITGTPAPDCGRQDAGAGRPGHDGERRRDRDRGSAPTPPTELSRICRDEAAAMFDRRPGAITVNAPIVQRTMTWVQGYFQEDGRLRVFNCRFDADGRFLGVS